MSKVIPCREAETRLPDYLNDTLEYTAGIEVSRHLARCPACWAKARGTMARALIQSEPQRAHQQRWGYLWSQIREAVQDPASPVASLRQAITTRWAAWADLSPSPVGAYQPAMAFAAPAGATAGSFRRSLSAREQERSRQERAAETPLYDVESVS
ncbi:MAG: zf-HC2 domain-containing protein, partial [SAR202 cluster bacterium]|nr:zf-HC2 domain-containing protein [SAR202 cluster bacterium]